jgi:hypothetical protein
MKYVQKATITGKPVDSFLPKTVAIGYSKFCELFTEAEWDGFDYT